MESPAARERGERAHRLGVVLNAALALLKIAGGLVSGSPALLADGYHSLADLATNGIAWLSFRVGMRPPDEDHHYGHGKAEAAAALFVGTVLLVAGGSVLWTALGQEAPDYGGTRAVGALAVALVSILANEWLVAVTRAAAIELESHALRALARDNRADSLSSVLVIIGVAGTLFGSGWLEPIATGAIGVFIVVMGLRSANEGLDVLMDRVADVDLRKRIAAAARGVEGVVDVPLVSVHPLGSVSRVDMEISVDGDLSVRKGHAIAHEVEAAIKQAEPRIVEVLVHVNPADGG